jgi:hypothetical protein
VSFGPKLNQLPATCSPGEEVPVTLEFVPDDEEFERELTIYVEEPGGIRPINVTVKSPPHDDGSRSR